MSLLDNLRHKFLRLRLPAPLRHHAHAHPQFALTADPSGPRAICWRGATVGRTADPNEIRNSRRGDCFIVCSGPSLSGIDLSALSHSPCIAVNGAIARFHDCGVSPAFYAATDPDFFDHRWEMVRQAMLGQSICFFSFAGLSRICERDSGLLSKTRIVSLDTVNQRYGSPRRKPDELDCHLQSDADFVLHSVVRHGDSVGFSKNIAKGVFCGRNIAFRAIQVAYHLGFRRVNLLGMDLGGNGSMVRFYESQSAARPSDLDRHYEPYIRPTFEIVRDMTQQEAFEVYNLSAQSRLPQEIISKRDLATALRVANTGATSFRTSWEKAA